jgi:carboxypeptidase PM20D1
MLKRLFLLLVIALVALAAVLLVRTARVPDPAPEVARGSAVAVDEQSAAERLAEAVRYRTISYQSGAPIDTVEYLGFHAFLARTFPRAHAVMQRELIGELSLLYTWPGADPTIPPVVLMGHMDVVPVPVESQPDWTHPPFDGVIADGFVWGRGTLDDKTTILAILEAVEEMAIAGITPVRTVYLAFGHDEEVGGRYGARFIVDTLLARGVKPAMVLDEGGLLTSGAIPGVEGQAAIVGIAEKGYLSLVLTARAQGGHSSMPPARTSVGALSAAIGKLLAQPFPASLDGPTRAMLEAMAPYSPFGQKLVLANLWLTEPLVLRSLNGTPLGAALTRTTIAPTMLDAGVKDNVLPPEASAVVNFRIRPGETRETVAARVRSVINDSMITVVERDSAMANPSEVSDIDSPAYQLIAQTIRTMTPGKQLPVLPYLVMGGTDAKFWGPHSDRVFRFLPVPLGPDDVPRIHGVDERLAVSDYRTAVGFFSQLLRGLGAL